MEEYSWKKVKERSVSNCGIVKREREGLFAFEGDSRTAKLVDFDG